MIDIATLEIEEYYLEKEKEVMCEFAKLYDDDLSEGKFRSREDLFNETFKTKDTHSFVPNKGASRTESSDSDLIIDRNGKRKTKFNL